MEKIGVILPESLPMPPVKGGAVENLLQMIVDLNEDSPRFHLIIYSTFDKKVEEWSRVYNYTQYAYFHIDTFGKTVSVFLKILRRLCRYLRIGQTPSLYEIKAYGVMKKETVHKLVLANCPYYSIYLNRYNDFHIIQYLHNDYLYELNLFTKPVMKSSQQYIAVSDFIKWRLTTILSPQARVDVCYNGINLSHYSSRDRSENKELRKTLGFHDTDKVIVYIGRLAENKGVKELLEAFLLIASEHKDWKLLIIGGHTFSSSTLDSYEESLHTLAQPIKDQVVFTGYVDYQEIPNYLAISDLCVVPSIQYESFNLVSVEAQAMGLPVIVTDAGGIVETVTPDSGVIVKRTEHLIKELAAAIENLLSDDDRMQEMSKAAIESAKRFPASKMFDRFVELVK